jgi:NTE family protein
MYVSVSQQYIKSRIETMESPQLQFDSKNKYWQTYLSFVLNSVDKKYFTTSGWKVRLQTGLNYSQSPDIQITSDGNSVPSDTLGYNFDNFKKLLVTADHYSPLSQKFVFSQHAVLGMIASDNPYPGNTFHVGGISEQIMNQVVFAGLNEWEVRTGSIATFQLGLQYKLAKMAYVTGRANVGVFDFYRGSDKETETASTFLSGYGLTFGLMTPIGPIEMTTMYCDQDGRLRTHLNIGFRF